MNKRVDPGARLTGLAALQQRLDPWLRGPMRALARLIYRPLARRRPVTVLIGAVPARFSFGTQPGVKRGELEPEARIFTHAIEAGATVLDVGAYHGTFSVLAGARVGPGGRVFAFEPTAESREYLRQNIALNGYEDRITVVPMVAGERPGQVEFYQRASDSTNTLFRPSSERIGFSSVTVEMTTLDATMLEAGGTASVVKIDVEGAEFSVLRGAELIMAARTRIFFEIHPYAWAEAGHSGTELVEWLAIRGRRMVWLGTNEPVTEFRYGNTELVPLS